MSDENSFDLKKFLSKATELFQSLERVGRSGLAAIREWERDEGKVVEAEFKNESKNERDVSSIHVRSPDSDDVRGSETDEPV